MAYLETLTSHNTQLQGLIDKANALPDAGSGGGSGEILTATVEIVTGGWARAFATVYEDGDIQSVWRNPTGSWIFENVVSGSSFVVIAQDTGGTFMVTGATAINSHVISDMEMILAHLYQVD